MRPAHPGGMFTEFCLPSTGMTIESAAVHMGVDADEFAEICHERAPITAEIAVRVSKAFGSTPEAWMRMQTAHDLSVANEQVGNEEIARLAAVPDAELDALEAGELPEIADVAD